MTRAALLLVLLMACGMVWAQETVVWVASPWEHVLKSTEPGEERAVAIKAGANEYEPLRIIVHAGERALADVNVTASALAGAAGTIPAENIMLFREHYLHVFEPSLRSTVPTGWYPDALIPFVNPEDGSALSGAKYDAVPFDVEAGANQGIWADVYVPADAAPGQYTGTVTVTAGGQTLEEGIDDSETGERLRMMVEDRHVNSLRLPFSYRSEPEKCKQYLGDLAAYLRERGWLDLAYIYMKDEPNNAEDYEVVRQQGALIHEADPGIKRMCTEQTITSNEEWGDLYGAVDIWCPLWGIWDEQTAQERLALGEQLWSYTALCQRDEKNPFWEIDYPPVVFRSPFWVSWHYDVTGFLYWSSVYWGDYEDIWAKPHFRDKYWGEGMLLTGSATPRPT